MDGNKPAVQNCGVAVVVAHDLEFFEHWEKLYPFGGPPDGYRADPSLAEQTAFRNGSLQGAYLILAARSLGLDVNPMSGFDTAKVDEIFFSGTNFRSNFICYIGYGEPESIPGPRAPRLDFDEACEVL